MAGAEIIHVRSNEHGRCQGRHRFTVVFFCVGGSTQFERETERAAAGDPPGLWITRGGEVRVRKLIALIMVALLALTMALAAVGCGKKAETTSETPPPENTMANPDSMVMDSTGMDTTMHH